VESQYEEQEEEDVWYNLEKLYKVISTYADKFMTLDLEDFGSPVAEAELMLHDAGTRLACFTFAGSHTGGPRQVESDR